MSQSAGEINVMVLSVLPARGFQGEAIRVHSDPRYVVALLLDKSAKSEDIRGADIALPTYQVVFFAIHSVAQTFATGDVLGKNFRLRIKMETVDGAKCYQLERI